LGGLETGGRAALPVFREVMLNMYQSKLVGPVPAFPANMEKNIQSYLSGEGPLGETVLSLNSPGTGEAGVDRVRPCRATAKRQATIACDLSVVSLPVVYQRRDVRGRTIFTNE